MCPSLLYVPMRPLSYTYIYIYIYNLDEGFRYSLRSLPSCRQRVFGLAAAKGGGHESFVKAALRRRTRKAYSWSVASSY